MFAESRAGFCNWRACRPGSKRVHYSEAANSGPVALLRTHGFLKRIQPG